MLWKNIEYQLNKKGWSIYKITKEAGLSKNLIYELKSGRINDMSFRNVCKMADALEISLDEFRKD